MARAVSTSGERARVLLPIEAVLESASHAVCVVAADGAVVAVNDAWRALWRHRDESVVDLGARYGLPLLQEVDDALHVAVAEVASRRREAVSPTRVVLRDRAETWLEIDVQPSELEGEPVALVQHFDVTHEAQSERRRRIASAATAASIAGTRENVARAVGRAAGWAALEVVDRSSRVVVRGEAGERELHAGHVLARARESRFAGWHPLSFGEAVAPLPSDARALVVCPSEASSFVLASRSGARPDDETLALVARLLGVTTARETPELALDSLVDRAAGCDATVLLLGESGTGKTRLGNLIHMRSARAARPFLDLNCAGLAPTLLESELFGHERGAFTGAHQRKRGLLELAEGGTVLLDEIGELDPVVQAKLLKVLETRSFRRVGGESEIAADVRFVAATNRDLRAEVRAGRFRADLYYRLAVVEIRIPPLRERAAHIPRIADEVLAAIGGASATRLSEAARRELMSRDWPGNIRELRNALERAALLARDGVVDVEEVRAALPMSEPAPLGDLLDDHAWRHVQSVLESTGYNVRRAAGLLGVARSTLYEWTRRRGVDLKAQRPSPQERGRK